MTCTAAQLRARADISGDPAMVVSVIGRPLTLPGTRAVIGFHKAPDPVFEVGSILTMHGGVALGLHLAGRVRIHGREGCDFGDSAQTNSVPRLTSIH